MLTYHLRAGRAGRATLRVLCADCAGRAARCVLGADRAGRAARRALACALAIGAGVGVAACGPLPLSPPPPPACAAAAGLRIDELMVDPDGPDHAGEWLELANTGATSVALDGLFLVVGAGPRQRRHRIRGAAPLGAGARWVAGNRAAPGSVLDYAYGAALAFPNRGGTVALHCGDAELSRVGYGAGTGPLPVPGAALQRDGGDAGTSWCVAAVATPGAANPPCPPPAAARIGEVLVDPEGADAGREWVEIELNSPGAPVGMALRQEHGGRTRRWALVFAPAMGPGAGPVALRVQSARAPLPPPPWGAAVGPATLVNGATRLTLHDATGACLDAIALAPARPGTACSRDAAGHWCAAAPPHGTPGAANPPCAETDAGATCAAAAP